MIINAQRQHQAKAIDLISAAFSHDPQFYAYTQGNQAKNRLIARLAFETCLASKTAFFTDDLNAVILCKPSIGKGFYIRPFLINLLFPFLFGIKPLLNLLKIENALEKKRQKTAGGLYIWMIATDPNHQGKGLGSALLSHIDSLATSQYSDIFLETAKVSNTEYYAKRGFVLYDELIHSSALTIYFMRKSSTKS